MRQSSVIETPSLGHPSFPTELLRCIILSLHPNDLPSLSAANRHLRLAVPAITGLEFAKLHLSQLAKRHPSQHAEGHRFYKSANKRTEDADELQEWFLRSIHFQHPLLLEYAVGVIALHGFAGVEKWADIASHVEKDKAAVFKQRLITVLSSAVRRGVWPARTSRQLTQDLRSVISMAARLHSTRLLDDLHDTFPERFQDGFQSDLFPLLPFGMRAGRVRGGLATRSAAPSGSIGARRKRRHVAPASHGGEEP
ncbi:hypothetical protein HDU96_006072 [Phlyctochytrium bullatum]|nr:hypothetical protein HDU96_006072 [Phlyctochytrium bullatum]